MANAKPCGDTVLEIDGVPLRNVVSFNVEEDFTGQRTVVVKFIPTLCYIDHRSDGGITYGVQTAARHEPPTIGDGAGRYVEVPD